MRSLVADARHERQFSERHADSTKCADEQTQGRDQHIMNERHAR
jgi:hypothetical protein